MVSRVFSLTEDFLSSAGVEHTYTEESEDIILYADDNQIAQIVINLLKNAVQAGADRIDISARIDNMECVIIDIANNGRPVSMESREDIFTPLLHDKAGRDRYRSQHLSPDNAAPQRLTPPDQKRQHIDSVHDGLQMSPCKKPLHSL